MQTFSTLYCSYRVSTEMDKSEVIMRLLDDTCQLPVVWLFSRRFFEGHVSRERIKLRLCKKGFAGSFSPELVASIRTCDGGAIIEGHFQVPTFTQRFFMLWISAVWLLFPCGLVTQLIKDSSQVTASLVFAMVAFTIVGGLLLTGGGFLVWTTGRMAGMKQIEQFRSEFERIIETPPPDAE